MYNLKYNIVFYIGRCDTVNYLLYRERCFCMSKKKYKGISLVLIMTIVFSSLSITPFTRVFAADNEISVIQNNNGQFTSTGNTKKSLRGKLLHRGLYSLEDGTLLLQVLPEVFEVVQKDTIKLNDNEKISDILNDDSISQDIKDDILRRSQQQAAINNGLAAVELYRPVNSEVTDTISPMTETNFYYTYVSPNGKSYKLKDTVLRYTNLESPECEYVSGPTAGTISDLIMNIVIAIAGTEEYIGIFSTGVSILQNFMTAMGARVYRGSANDRAWFRVKYDIWTKWTFVDITGDGGWATGAVTEMVYKRSAVWYEYFTTDKGGNSKTDTVNYYAFLISPNYDNPAPLAVQWAGSVGWVENNISMKVHGTVFVY